jgi:hypothetical protein
MNLETNPFQIFLLNQRSFDLNAVALTKQSLEELLKQLPTKEKQVIQLHEALLFTLAYPATLEIFQLAEAVMLVLVQTVTQKVKKDANAFYNSGITGSLVCAKFGLLLNQYLLEQNIETLELAGIDGESSDLVTKLNFTLNTIEQELMPDEAGYFKQWQKQYIPDIKSKRERLAYFIHAIMQMNGSISYRENLLLNFDLYSQFSLDLKLLGLSLGRLPQATIHLHQKGIRKKVSIQEVMDLGKPQQIKLKLKEQEKLVQLARGSMASLLRETDTFTYAQIHETELFQMGEGIQIALYYMIPEQKFALQSYVGYLLFKNGLPMAYGGCWILAKQAAFGVNVLPPYRGGESSLVVAQLLRLYCFRFGLNRFTVDPYQIGKGNSDGIASGAFWFYYKLGFRPKQKSLFDLAELEVKKMELEKGYRTPAKTLVKLADADIFIDLQGAIDESIELSNISRTISTHVNSHFQGNRKLALESARKKAKKFAKLKIKSDSFASHILVFLDAKQAFEKLSKSQLQQILTAFDLKGSAEAKAHASLQKIKSFGQLLS